MSAAEKLIREKEKEAERLEEKWRKNGRLSSDEAAKDMKWAPAADPGRSGK